MFYEKVVSYCEEKQISIMEFERKCNIGNGTVGRWKKDNSIKKAVCSLTEIIYQIELAEKNAVSQASASATDICVGGKSTGVVTSVSSGSESISYATPQQICAGAKEWSAVYSVAGDTQKTNDLLLKTALPLLMGVRTDEGIPILYAGMRD